MSGTDRADHLWSFPDGMLGPDDSIKGFEVEASDGHAGKVSWTSYAPGESYLIVSHMHHLHEVHHVVPAGTIVGLDKNEHTVSLRISRDQVEELPQQREPAAPADPWLVEAWDWATGTRSLGGDML